MIITVNWKQQLFSNGNLKTRSLRWNMISTFLHKQNLEIWNSKTLFFLMHSVSIVWNHKWLRWRCGAMEFLLILPNNVSFFSRNFSQPCWHCHASVLITDSNWNKDEGDQIKTNNLLRIYFAISCFAFTSQCLFFIRLTAITIWFFAIQNSNHETFIESLAGKILLFY